MRGALYASVLAVVAEGETYGYVIAQRLQEAGLGLVKGGTLYPILGRLEQEGLVRSRWQAGEAAPNRKYFTVTRDGLTARAPP
jgi:PadR family transcriptional regulator PadR